MYIPGDICPDNVRTMSAQHLTKDICLTREMLCGHSAEIVRTYISRDICPQYILLRFSALELNEFTLPYSLLLIALLIVKHSFESSCPSLDWSVGPLVCHNFQEGHEVTLTCSYRSTYFIEALWTNTYVVLRELHTDQPTDQQTDMRVHREVTIPTSAPIGAWKCVTFGAIKKGFWKISVRAMKTYLPQVLL